MKTRRGIATSVAIAALLLLGQAGAALANGVGDLYLATRAGVLEVHVVASQVVNTVPIVPPPTALAFSPDGKSLFVASDGTRIVRIDIETLDTDEPVAMPGVVTALAFPSGQVLVGAVPSDSKLVFYHPAGGEVTESDALPGTPNLLAGDRHDPRAVAAEAGKSWVAVVNPTTGDVTKTDVPGEVQAIAMDRDSNGVLVATAKPNAVIRLELPSLTATWTAGLSAKPTAVAAMAGLRVAAAGTTIYSVGDGGAKSWAEAKGTITALASSDEGKVLHAVEPAALEVFDVTGKSQRTMALSGDRAPVALAAVPAGSSLFTGAAHASPGTSAGSTTGGKSGAAGSGEPPVTSTIVDGVQRLIDEPSAQGAAIVGIAILLACWLAIHMAERRRRALR